MEEAMTTSSDFLENSVRNRREISHSTL